MRGASLAVVYHSACGHTALLARSVFRGAETVPAVTPYLIAVDGADAPWQRLVSVDAIVFGSPTYLGGPAAAFKAFQDASWDTVLNAGFLWKDKLAAGFTVLDRHAGDALGTLLQMVLFAARHGMMWVSPGLDSAGPCLGAAARLTVRNGTGSVPARALQSAAALGRRTGLLTLRQAGRTSARPPA